MWLDAVLPRGTRSIFLVNAVPLVAQQSGYIERNSRRGLSVQTLSSHGGSQSFAEVIVGTAETIRRAIVAGQIAAQSVGAIVVDEAHHAVGDHPYVQVMRLFEQDGLSPHVLGLTASALHGELKNVNERLANLEGTLGAKIFSPGGPERKIEFKKVAWKGTGAEKIAMHRRTYAAAREVALKHAAYQGYDLKVLMETEVEHAEACLAALGGRGYALFLAHGLVPLIEAKLGRKLAYMEDPASHANMQLSKDQLPVLQERLYSALEDQATGEPPTGKVASLFELLATHQDGRTLVFVERACVAYGLAMLLSELGIPARPVCGTLTMEEPRRRSYLDQFRKGEVNTLVATATLEEGLDVPDCQYVVRFDSFHTVKSHVQGAGRARCTAGAIAFYFDNLPEVEEQKRSVVDAIVRGDEVSEAALNQAITADETQGTAGEGEGEGHTWSAESTQWDYATNASFRGCKCPCGAVLKISSRAFGKGRKKKERVFSVEGPYVCPNA
jgi:endoribonuclease Dicer